MTLIEIIILGYIVNLFLIIAGVIQYIIKLSNEKTFGELATINNKTKKSRVPGGFWIPYGVILERIMVQVEYSKFKKQGGTRFIDFINYMMIDKETTDTKGTEDTK